MKTPEEIKTIIEAIDALLSACTRLDLVADATGDEGAKHLSRLAFAASSQGAILRDAYGEALRRALVLSKHDGAERALLIARIEHKQRAAAPLDVLESTALVLACAQRVTGKSALVSMNVPELMKLEAALNRTLAQDDEAIKASAARALAFITHKAKNETTNEG